MKHASPRVEDITGSDRAELRDDFGDIRSGRLKGSGHGEESRDRK